MYNIIFEDKTAQESVYFYHGDHLGSASWIIDANGIPVQHFQHVAWGEEWRNQKAVTSTYEERYTFTGKEVDSESDYTYFDHRYYLCNLGIFISPDPLSDKYPSISPYAYCGNNPIMLVDPDGREAVYDPRGNWLGTDEKGINGGHSYFIMDKKHFKQGMSQQDVQNTLYQGTVSLESQQKIWDHAATLSSRPDADGIVTITEGISWAKLHPNALDNPSIYNTLYIDAAKCNFGSLSSDDFNSVGLNKSVPINLYNTKNIVYSIFNKNIRNTVYALGRVDVMLNNRENNSIVVLNTAAATYDWNLGGGFNRNLAISINNLFTGINPDIHGFKVNIVGKGRLSR